MPKGKNITKVVNRNGRYGRRCLGKGLFIDNDSYKTGLNNHDLIVAGSRGGKTGCIVYPQLKMAGDCSLIVTDSKRLLHRMFREELEMKGYRVRTLDFVDPENSCMYNPLDYVRVNKDGSYNELDIMKISMALVPERMDAKDPFWSVSARAFLDFFIGYCLEALPEEDHIMDTVGRLYRTFTGEMGEAGFLGWIDRHQDSFVAKRYAEIKSIQSSEKTLSSIYAFVNTALYPFDVKQLHNIFGWPVQYPEPDDYEDMEDLAELYGVYPDDEDVLESFPAAKEDTNKDTEAEGNVCDYLDIASLGKEKTVLFLNISDTDHCMDSLVNLFYTQVLQTLVSEADEHDNGQLEVPCRIIFDDFAGGATIPDFDKIISVVGSRDIWLTMCVQSLSQLESLYSPAQALTIRNNCDHMVYMGGSDPGTADYIGLRAGKIPESILAMPRSKEYFIEGGKKAQLKDKVPPYSFVEEDEKPDEMPKLPSSVK